MSIEVDVPMEGVRGPTDAGVLLRPVSCSSRKGRTRKREEKARRNLSDIALGWHQRTYDQRRWPELRYPQSHHR